MRIKAPLPIRAYVQAHTARACRVCRCNMVQEGCEWAEVVRVTWRNAHTGGGSQGARDRDG